MRPIDQISSIRDTIIRTAPATSSSSASRPSDPHHPLPPGHVDRYPRERNQSTLDSVLVARRNVSNNSSTTPQSSRQQHSHAHGDLFTEPVALPTRSSAYRPLSASSSHNSLRSPAGQTIASSQLPYPTTTADSSANNPRAPDQRPDDRHQHRHRHHRHKHRSSKSKHKRHSRVRSESAVSSDLISSVGSSSGRSASSSSVDTHGLHDEEDGAMPDLSEATQDYNMDNELDEFDINQLAQPLSEAEQRRAVQQSLQASTFESHILRPDRPFILPMEVDQDAIHALLESKRNKLRKGEHTDRCYMCRVDVNDPHYIHILDMARKEITFRSMDVVCENIIAYFNLHVRPTVKYRWPWTSVVEHFKEHRTEDTWLQKSSINRWSNVCETLARGLANVDPGNTNIRIRKETFNMLNAAESRLTQLCSKAKWLHRKDGSN